MTFDCGWKTRKGKVCGKQFTNFYELLEHLWYKHRYKDRAERPIVKRLLVQAEHGQL